MNRISNQLSHLDESINNKVDWRYEMRRDAQETLPGLYVGPFQPSWNLTVLQNLGITHILCIAESRESYLFKPKFDGKFLYLTLEIRDADDQNLIRIFPETHSFIDNALTGGGRVLVHCGDGISRSPAVVTAYVMCKTGLSHDDAFTFVQNRRFCVAPRVEFQHQLEAYAPIFLAGQMVARDSGAQIGQQRSKRRGREDSDDDLDDEDDDMMRDDAAPARDMDMSQRIRNWHPTPMPMPTQ